MLGEDHLEKAKRIEKTVEKLDMDADWETIVEAAYGIAHNLIAYITEKNKGEHLDSHKGLNRFLDGSGYFMLSKYFRELDGLRQGRWYGGKQNGVSARRALEIVAEIRKMVDETNVTGVDIHEQKRKDTA